MNRRRFLNVLAQGAAGLCLRDITFAQQDSASIAANRLTENFVRITGAGGNVLVVTTSDGVLMVDGGLAERTAALLKIVIDQSKAERVQVLFNTDWHWEHTGSNETLRKAGAKIWRLRSPSTRREGRPAILTREYRAR